MKNEHAIQAHIVTLLRMKGYITFDCDVMNALRYLPSRDVRRVLYANQHKALGYTVGQPDLIAVAPDDVLFIEMKNGKLGRQSKEQKALQAQLTRMGQKYFVWRDVQDAINYLQAKRT